MRRLRCPLLALACLGLLAAQLSGLHMHIDTYGYVGTPEGTHVHRTALHVHDRAPLDHAAMIDHAGAFDHDHPGDPDHEGNRDISVIDPGVGVSKLLIFLAWSALGLIIVLRLARRIRIPAVAPPRRTRRDRWRPPLRAPPLLSLR